MCHDKTRPIHGGYAGAATLSNQASDEASAFGRAAAGGPVRVPLRERLTKELMNLDQRRFTVMNALEALDRDPEFEKHDVTREALDAVYRNRY